MSGIVGNGAIAGIGEGIKNGLITGMTLANARQNQNMAMALNGLTKDQDGNIIPTESKQKELQAKGLLADQTIRESDPNSPLAKATGDFYKSQNFTVPEGMSYGEQKSLVEPLATAKAKGIIAGDLKSQSFEHSDRQFDERNNKQDARNAQKQWTQQFGVSSPIIQRLEGSNRILNLIKAGESGQIQTTKQFLNRANAEVSALETGKNNFALGSQERTELESSAADLRAILNKVFNEQKGTDLSAQLKELKANMLDMSNSYMDNADRIAVQMETGAPDAGTEALKKKHEALKNQYSQVFGHWGSQGHGLIGQAPGQALQQDPQIAAFANQNGLEYAHAEQIINTRKTKMGTK